MAEQEENPIDVTEEFQRMAQRLDEHKGHDCTKCPALDICLTRFVLPRKEQMLKLLEECMKDPDGHADLLRATVETALTVYRTIRAGIPSDIAWDALVYACDGDEITAALTATFVSEIMTMEYQGRL